MWRASVPFSFDQIVAVAQVRPGLATRLAAQLRVAALAYLVLALAIFGAATGAALLNPSLLNPRPLDAMQIAPYGLKPVLQPPMLPTSQDVQRCLDWVNGRLAQLPANVQAETELRRVMLEACVNGRNGTQAGEMRIMRLP